MVSPPQILLEILLPAVVIAQLRKRNKSAYRPFVFGFAGLALLLNGLFSFIAACPLYLSYGQSRGFPISTLHLPVCFDIVKWALLAYFPASLLVEVPRPAQSGGFPLLHRHRIALRHLFVPSVSLLFLSSVTSAQQAITDDLLKTVCGTWANTRYVGDRQLPQKVVLKTDLTFEAYQVITQNSPNEKGDFTIVSAWKDARGCRHFKATVKSNISAVCSFEHWKLDSLGTSWESEFTFAKNSFPDEVNAYADSSKGFFYSIYSRQPDDGSSQVRDTVTVEDHTQYVYKTTGGRRLKAYVFKPTSTSGGHPRSCILLFHGGGWVSGDPEWAFWLARHFASLGMVAVAVQYRLSDQFMITPIEAMADARAAFRWVRAHASSLGIDTSHIAAYGWSAGAHLAAAAAMFSDDSPRNAIGTAPNALILVSPAVDVGGDGWAQQLLGTRAEASSVSPATHVRSGLPPTLILQGRHDTVTPLHGVELFSNKMKSAGNECQLVIYEGVGHLFTPDSLSDQGQPRPDESVQAHALNKADEFLAAHGYAAKP